MFSDDLIGSTLPFAYVWHSFYGNSSVLGTWIRTVVPAFSHSCLISKRGLSFCCAFCPAWPSVLGNMQTNTYTMFISDTFIRIQLKLNNRFSVNWPCHSAFQNNTCILIIVRLLFLIKNNHSKYQYPFPFLANVYFYNCI